VSGAPKGFNASGGDDLRLRRLVQFEPGEGGDDGVGVGFGGGRRGGGVWRPVATEAAGLGAAAIVTQDEHDEAVVAVAAIADQLAAGDDRDHLAVQRTVERLVLQAQHAHVERGLPCPREALRPPLAAKLVCALGAHVHLRRGAGDRAGVGQRLDEGDLAGGSPAVVTGLAAGHRLEGRQRGAGIARYGRAVDHDGSA
jgi:hypothetical protein